jgi:hypothetical protein
MCQKRCLIDVISLENDTDFKIGDPNCICSQKMAEGTCESYQNVMQFRNCLTLYRSKRWKHLFLGKRYHLKMLQEIFSDCLSRSYLLN